MSNSSRRKQAFFVYGKGPSVRPRTVLDRVAQDEEDGRMMGRDKELLQLLDGMRKWILPEYRSVIEQARKRLYDRCWPLSDAMRLDCTAALGIAARVRAETEDKLRREQRSTDPEGSGGQKGPAESAVECAEGSTVNPKLDIPADSETPVVSGTKRARGSHAQRDLPF